MNKETLDPKTLAFIRENWRELRQRLAERDEADKRIAQLHMSLRGMAPLMPPQEKETLLSELAAIRKKPVGLTEAVGNVLKESQGMTATEVRDAIEHTGFDLSEYSQAMATIHIVLKRMLDKQVVKRRGTRGGSYVYHWVGE